MNPSTIAPFTIWEYVIPFGLFGLLFAAILVFLYIYSKTRDQVFLSAALFGLTAATFMFFEEIITIYGGYFDNIELARSLHRWQQVLLLFVCAAYPFMALRFLTMTPFMRRLSRGAIGAGFGLVLLFGCAAFIAPETYISMTRPMAVHPVHEYAVTRGANGWLYQVRDGFLFLLIIYAVSVFVVEVRNKKNLRDMLLPLAGLAVLVLGSIDDIVQAYLGYYPDFLPNMHFSRFGTGATVFAGCIMTAMLRDFFAVYKVSRANQEHLERLYSVNHDLLEQITKNAGELDSASGGLASVFEVLSRNAVSMKGRASDLTRAVENLDRSIQSVSSSAGASSITIDTVSAASGEFAASITEISRESSKARTDMAAVVERVSGAIDQMNRLGSQTREITGIINMIRKIADQTKLLALNATIEAASAGEAGRGFAVVASEVKALAQKVNSAVDNVESGIGETLSLAENTVGVIAQIGEHLTAVQASVDTIAVSVEEQSATTAEIAQSIKGAAQESKAIDSAVQGVVETLKTLVADAETTGKASAEVEASSRQVSAGAKQVAEISGRLQKLMKQAGKSS